MRRKIARTIAGLSVAGAAILSPLTVGLAQAETSAPATPAVGPPCPEGMVCVFDEAGFSGQRIDYFYCGPPQDVRDAGLARVGSYINNQTDDQVASFFGQDENNEWILQYTSTAVDANADTTALTTYGVQSC